MKPNIRCRALLMLALALSLPLYAMARPAALRPAAAPQSVAEQVEQWLKQSGYNYRNTGTGTWVINYTKSGGASEQIIVASGTDFVVFGVVVAVKKDINRTSEMMFKLLRLNHSIDYVKIGFDDDEDLFVRTEVKFKQMDFQEFKANVERNATAAATIRDAIRAYLAK